MTSIKETTTAIRGGTESRREIDYNDDGVVDRTEIVREFDYNNDGKVDNHVEVTVEKVDLDGDGRQDDTITRSTVDSNGDGVTDQTITRTDREVDSNSDGVADVHYTDLEIDTDGDGNNNSETHERVEDFDENSDGKVDRRKRTTRSEYDDDDDGRMDRARNATVWDDNADGRYDRGTVDGPFKIVPETPAPEPVSDVPPMETENVAVNSDPSSYPPFEKYEPRQDTRVRPALAYGIDRSRLQEQPTEEIADDEMTDDEQIDDAQREQLLDELDEIIDKVSADAPRYVLPEPAVPSAHQDVPPAPAPDADDEPERLFPGTGPEPGGLPLPNLNIDPTKPVGPTGGRPLPDIDPNELDTPTDRPTLPVGKPFGPQPFRDGFPEPEIEGLEPWSPSDGPFMMIFGPPIDPDQSPGLPLPNIDIDAPEYPGGRPSLRDVDPDGLYRPTGGLPIPDLDPYGPPKFDPEAELEGFDAWDKLSKEEARQEAEGRSRQPSNSKPDETDDHGSTEPTEVEQVVAKPAAYEPVEADMVAFEEVELVEETPQVEIQQPVAEQQVDPSLMDSTYEDEQPGYSFEMPEQAAEIMEQMESGDLFDNA